MMQSPLSIKLEIPIQWQTGPAPQGADGVLLLRVLALIEANALHFDEDDGPDALRWQALEARVDLTLQLLGQLLARAEPLPARNNLLLSGEGLTCVWPMALPIGQVGTVALHLSPRIPQALYLPGVITRCNALDQGYDVAMHFSGLDSELQDWLEKTIFRRHRREIFERKHANDE